MTFSRRRWLSVLIFSPGWLALLRRSARAAGEADDSFAFSIRAMVDTLVPADESPGAVALGIHEHVVANIRTQPQYLATAEQGVAWLDAEAQQQYGEVFAALDEAAREALLGRAERSPRSSAQHQLFAVLRDETLRRYYAHPDAWPQLGYRGPPQPRGFMNYTDAPTDRRG